MNTRALWAATALWASLHPLCLYAPPGGTHSTTARFLPVKVRIRVEGTSNLDDWQVEARTLKGFLEVDPAFPGSPSGNPSVNPMAAHCDLSLEAHSLRSVEKDGKPFSNKMDGIMHEALRAKDHPQLTFHLLRLDPKSRLAHTEAPWEFETRGLLSVAGVTNEISMVVNVVSLNSDQIRLSGSTTVKMTDYHIEPPSPKIALGLIRTDDQVKLTIDTVFARVH